MAVLSLVLGNFNRKRHAFPLHLPKGQPHFILILLGVTEFKDQNKDNSLLLTEILLSNVGSKKLVETDFWASFPSYR